MPALGAACGRTLHAATSAASGGAPGDLRPRLSPLSDSSHSPHSRLRATAAHTPSRPAPPPTDPGHDLADHHADREARHPGREPLELVLRHDELTSAAPSTATITPSVRRTAQG